MVDSTNLPEVDINQIATDLNGKMDRDGVNAECPTLLSRTPNNQGGVVEIWSDGYCVQTGYATQTVTFSKPYINTNYIITLGKMQNDNTTDNAVLQVYTKSTTGFTLYRGWGNGSGGPRTQDMWRTEGYIR